MWMNIFLYGVGVATFLLMAVAIIAVQVWFVDENGAWYHIGFIIPHTLNGYLLFKHIDFVRKETSDVNR